MNPSIEIPGNIKNYFLKLTKLIPVENRSDVHFQRILCLYLKFGGFDLARQYVEVTNMTLREKEFEKRFYEDSLPETLEPDNNETANSHESVQLKAAG